MSAIPLYGHTVTCLQPVDAKQLSEESVAQNIRHRPAYPAECVGYITLGLTATECEDFELTGLSGAA